MIETRESRFGNHSLVVLRPAPKDRIEFAYEPFRRSRHRAFDDAAHPFVKRFRVLPAGLDQHLSAVLTEVPSKELEPLVNVDQPRLFRGQRQPPLAQERLDPWLDNGFEQLFRAASDHEIIRITDDVHLRLLGCIEAKRGLDVPLQTAFQPVERDVRQCR